MMNGIASEIQSQYKKRVNEYETIKEIAGMLTDAIVSANVSDVAESPKQLIEKIDKDIDEFTKRYKRFRTDKEEILMKAIESQSRSSTDKSKFWNRKVYCIHRFKTEVFGKRSHNDRGKSMEKAIDKIYQHGI